LSISIGSDTDWRTARWSRHMQVVLKNEVWDITMYLNPAGLPDGVDIFLDGTLPMIIPAEILDFVDQHQQIKPNFDDQQKFRNTDKPSARIAAEEIKIRANSARHKLLMAHYSNRNGYTDEEAATHAGLPLTSEYATRCSELERAGLLASMHEHRTGKSGALRVVRRITQKGVVVAETVCREG
jgi:hypothetical protein